MTTPSTGNGAEAREGRGPEQVNGTSSATRTAQATRAPSPPPSRPLRPRLSLRPARKGTLTACLAVLLALVVSVPDRIPNSPGHLGSLVETVLPWTVLAIPALIVPALVRRSPLAALSLVLPVTMWGTLFGSTLADKSSPGGDLTIVSHNVNQENPDPKGTVERLLASKADVLALEELTPRTASAYEHALASVYPYHSFKETVGLWSIYPLSDVHALPIVPWTRAMRATVETPEGSLTAYVVHLPSVRVNSAGFTTRARNEALGRLTAELRRESARNVVVLGDFNGSADDRAMRPLTRRFASAQTTAGDGFGFTWPSRFPVVRIDQIFVKGAKATSAWTLPATASDHLPVAARLDLRRHTPSG
ncbi:endonuclease/exonuclease/phosphatase family protein [Streptomyces sp. NPDC004976]